MLRASGVGIVVLAAFLPSGEAGAQVANQQAVPAAAAARSFDPAPVVAEVRRLIRERYVLPERRPALDAVLAEGLRSGRYRVREPGMFAERLSADLARVGQDKHLYFNYQPDRYAVMTARTPSSQPDSRAQQEQVRRVNHGVQELRLLPGNVRYLDLASWQWTGDETRAALDAAMAFLKAGDAVIIDVRRNGGGNGAAVQHVISHFMDPGRPLVTFYRGDQASPTVLSVEVANGMVGKPLYVLTSGGTGSASEEFAGNVAGYRLGETVGERTSGAGYMNGLYPIEGGFVLSVSVARSLLASTGRDWEAAGIAATIASPPEEALQTAHLLALRRLAAADETRRPGLEAILAGLEAMIRPGRPALPLTAYVGTYGDRQVMLEGSTLWYRQAERMRRRLVPLSGNQFTLMDDPSLRVGFKTAGSRVTGFDLGPAIGPVQGMYERTR